MKRIVLLISLITLGLIVQAQNYKIVSVEYLKGDMSARENIKEDGSGRQCALFRIATQNITPKVREGFLFDCDYASDVVQRVVKGGEIFLWVSPGIKTLKIKHEEYGSYDLHLSKYLKKGVESLSTYKIVLQGTVSTNNTKKITEQYLIFKITPTDAILEVNGRVWPVAEDGTSKRMVSFGNYEYSVESHNYHKFTGTIEVNDPDEPQTIIVDLSPNFGWIEVPNVGNLSGASVYIDNKFIGIAPCKSEGLSSGEHAVKIVKDLYDTYNETVEVSDNQIAIVDPMLVGNFAFVTLKVDANAEIWVNDELVGQREWSGDLPIGTCLIECKMEGHKTTSLVKEISKDMEGATFNLSKPTPLYGMLDVDCNPDLCSIYIDNQPYGKTPKLIGKVLEGKHELRIVKEGYQEHTRTIEIKHNERQSVVVALVPRDDYNPPVSNDQVKIYKPVAPKVTKQGDDYYYGSTLITPTTNFADLSPYISKEEFGKALRKYNKRSAFYGLSTGFLTGAFLGGYIINKSSDEPPLGDWYFISTGAVAGLLWIRCFTLFPQWDKYLRKCYQKHNQKVDEIYREYDDRNKTDLSLHFGVTPSGVGVSLNF